MVKALSSGSSRQGRVPGWCVGGVRWGEVCKVIIVSNPNTFKAEARLGWDFGNNGFVIHFLRLANHWKKILQTS